MRALRFPRRALAVLCGMAAVACGGAAASSPTPSLPSGSSGMTVNELAAGRFDSAATGSQFLRIVRFIQAPNQSVASKKHQAGIVYVAAGEQRLAYADGTGVDIHAGTAVFLQSVIHSHTTLPPAMSTWYFIALWPDTPQSAVLVAPSTAVFQTEDLPLNVLQPDSYTETLRRVTLQPGGRSPAHQFGGLEMLYVLDGTLRVDVAGQAPVQLPAGQGTYVAPQTLTQEVATGGQKVDYLAYFVTEQGKPFETNAKSAPPG